MHLFFFRFSTCFCTLFSSFLSLSPETWNYPCVCVCVCVCVFLSIYFFSHLCCCSVCTCECSINICKTKTASLLCQYTSTYMAFFLFCPPVFFLLNFPYSLSLSSFFLLSLASISLSVSFQHIYISKKSLQQKIMNETTIHCFWPFHRSFIFRHRLIGAWN
jgi:hypothetical protein